MTVYVDESKNVYHRYKMCHMFAVDLDELHRMADSIGVARRHFQDPWKLNTVSWPHYDIAQTKKKAAIALGAEEIDRYQFSVMANYIKLYHLGLKGDPLHMLRRHWVLPAVEKWLAEQVGKDKLKEIMKC